MTLRARLYEKIGDFWAPIDPGKAAYWWGKAYEAKQWKT